MAFKGLLVGVYASNGAIRAMFLPMLYLLLSAPFILVLVFYFQAKVGFLDKFFQGRDPTDIFLQVFISVVAFTLPTRILSGRSWKNSHHEGKRRVQQIPYWIPGFRNWFNIAFGGEAWLRGVRETVFLPVFAYHAAGTKHNVVLSPNMLDQLLKKKDGLEEAEVSEWAALQNAFNMPKSLSSRYFDIKPEVLKVTEMHIFKGRVENVLASTFPLICQSLPDLISFNSSLVDQMPWERVAGIELTEGVEEVESEFFTLFNEFFCSMLIPPIAGDRFSESYQLLASDLTALNQYYYALANKIPRLFPLAGLTGAILAKNRLLQNLERLFDDLSNPPKKKVPEDEESLSGSETDADTPTPFSILNELFIKFDIDYSARATLALHILHGIFSEIVPVASWTLLYIYKHSDESKDDEKTLVEKLRIETKDWAKAVQPPSIHPSFPAPPEISFVGLVRAVDGTSLPLLRSCINETRRLYTSSLYTVAVTEPLTLTDASNVRPGAQEEWEFDVGSHIDIGLSQTLINSSVASFLSPNEYKPDRFVNAPAPSSVTTAASNNNEPYTTALLMALVAGVVQLWEIGPAPKKSLSDHWNEAAAAASGEKINVNRNEGKKGTWVVPKVQDAARFKMPKGETKVRIRRREALPEQKMYKQRK